MSGSLLWMCDSLFFLNKRQQTVVTGSWWFVSPVSLLFAQFVTAHLCNCKKKNNAGIQHSFRDEARNGTCIKVKSYGCHKTPPLSIKATVCRNETALCCTRDTRHTQCSHCHPGGVWEWGTVSVMTFQWWTALRESATYWADGLLHSNDDDQWHCQCI